MRSIVTSQNKREFEESKVAKKKLDYDKDLKAAELATKKASKAKTLVAHEEAAAAHKQATLSAHPAENIEKHFMQAKIHADEAKKMMQMEAKKPKAKEVEKEETSSIKQLISDSLTQK